MFIDIRKNFAAVITSGAVLALLTACGGTDNGSMGGHDASTMSSSAPATTSASARPEAVANDADVMFAQMMIPHHQQAVDMADLAGTRAADKAVKDLAEKIRAAQDPEIRTMQGWLTAWGKPMPSGGMSHGMPGIMSEEDMTKLEKARGTAFDKQFLHLMIMHHAGAIEMARTEQSQGSDPEAKELAETIETAQQAEVEQMREILARL
ncbi:DUF305 domain-containing protein [Nonomuraea sp. NPDC005501]|uniref:DUF305 domain-containing protein n=1 Tax=Nonomuraea sp. NPDC005501 TaxID=3156884 RepID=UPI0033A9EA99